ncbi:MAG TPA: MBL fold metallo-hydrolase [Spirochaetota bacterium]|nr:MBL fold metallo-hydrolase [Spirochaetota bacterium]HPS86493.1 MBL fold metallo-hydrolase [Spirochaetota bacterium]
MINKDYEKEGLYFFTLPKKKGNGSDISNTYVLNTGKRWYIIDTSCGKKRYIELKEFLKDMKDYTILCTHYHNDHIANNGKLVHKNGEILYHPRAADKVPYLRTNGTGQILMMYDKLDKKGFLQRLGYFSDSFINFILKRKITSKYIMIPLLYTVAYLFSLKTIGRINAGKNRIRFFDDSKKIKINLNGFQVEGWRVDDDLYAIGTPGHTDCHVMYYSSTKKILFTGDSLNFLTPNDIQYGELTSTIESQKMIFELVEKDNVRMICQGHYTPLADNESIKEYIADTITKHEHVYKKIRGYVNSDRIKLPFDDLYKEICAMDDPVIQKLVKITFPRSTLVFLDVYLHKVIEDIRLNENIINYEEHPANGK